MRILARTLAVLLGCLFAFALAQDAFTAAPPPPSQIVLDSSRVAVESTLISSDDAVTLPPVPTLDTLAPVATIPLAPAMLPAPLLDAPLLAPALQRDLRQSYIPVEDPCIYAPCALIESPRVELRYRNFTSFGIDEAYESDEFTVSFRSLNHTVPLFFLFLDEDGFEQFEAGAEDFPYYSGSIVPVPYPDADPESLEIKERVFRLTRYFKKLFVVFSNESPLSTEVAHCDFELALSYRGLGCMSYFVVVLAIPACFLLLIGLLCCGPCYRQCCHRCDPYGVRRQHAAHQAARRQRVIARERAHIDRLAARRAAKAEYVAAASAAASAATSAAASPAGSPAATGTSALAQANVHDNALLFAPDRAAGSAQGSEAPGAPLLLSGDASLAGSLLSNSSNGNRSGSGRNSGSLPVALSLAAAGSGGSDAHAGGGYGESPPGGMMSPLADAAEDAAAMRTPEDADIFHGDGDGDGTDHGSGSDDGYGSVGDSSSPARDGGDSGARAHAGPDTSNSNGEWGEDLAAAKRLPPAYIQYDFSEEEEAVYVQPATCWYCCVYRPYQFTQPAPMARTFCPAPGRCRMPYPRCCPSLYYFTGRPLTDYAHWWRQRALATWPWNPIPDEDILKFRHRLLLLVTVLVFNLLVLTRWAARFAELNKGVQEKLALFPVLGQYAVVYIGTSIIQDVFTALMRPVMALTLHVAPRLKRSPSPLVRAAGYAMYYTGVTLALIVLALVVMASLDLAQRYRCWVLETQVLLPFLLLSVFRMFFCFAVVPLPVFYYLQSAYGAMIPPGVDVRTGELYADPARRARALHPYGANDDDARSVAVRAALAADPALERAACAGDYAAMDALGEMVERFGKGPREQGRDRVFALELGGADQGSLAALGANALGAGAYGAENHGSGAGGIQIDMATVPTITVSSTASAAGTAAGAAAGDAAENKNKGLYSPSPSFTYRPEPANEASAGEFALSGAESNANITYNDENVDTGTGSAAGAEDDEDQGAESGRLVQGGDSAGSALKQQQQQQQQKGKKNKNNRKK